MMARLRLDEALVTRRLVVNRSQADSFIRMGKVLVNNQVAQKSGQFVSLDDKISLSSTERYVSRAGHKLASVADKLQLDFRGKVVLDVGSSTGGFTDFALQHGAKQVIAVDVGTTQLHESLRSDDRIELHEKTDIRDFNPNTPVDIVLVDVSFISVRDIFKHLLAVSQPSTEIVIMLKPQFEAGAHNLHGGVVKNDTVRREVMRRFELWVKPYCRVLYKADSEVAGSKGNQERFYLLHPLTKQG